VVGTCVATWFFGENHVGRSTARGEGKKETERDATELITGDKSRGQDMDYSQLKELGQDGVDGKRKPARMVEYNCRMTLKVSDNQYGRLF